jgi:hypothetical protein
MFCATEKTNFAPKKEFLLLHSHNILFSIAQNKKPFSPKLGRNMQHICWHPGIFIFVIFFWNLNV